ncbi:protein rep [Sporosarcina sp. P16b]|uniref:protein rep n=1 Tax=Sporosarcina sp. P16b TaxID=2048261 RepID=UPI001E2B22FF|nr:protein rep [Sporosarcina sp. P16b]
MKFNYANFGDILYDVETFRCEFQGKETADIISLNFLEDNQYSHLIEMTNGDAPNTYRKITSLGTEVIASFNSKQEDLREEIDRFNQAINRLFQRRNVKCVVKGYIRKLKVTTDQEKYVKIMVVYCVNSRKRNWNYIIKEQNSSRKVRTFNNDMISVGGRK